MENNLLQTMENNYIEGAEPKVFSNRKKRIVLFAAIVCCIAVIASGTFAYFVAEETNYNVITTGKPGGQLIEESTGGGFWPEEGIHDVMPGNVIDKVVYVKNTGGIDFYVRIWIEKIINPAPGVNAQLNFDKITLDINDEDWTEKDGYYYYNKALVPDEKTIPLFTKVTFGTDLGNEYMDAKAKIIVHVQLVQSKNNGDSPLDAVGWSSNDYTE